MAAPTAGARRPIAGLDAGPDAGPDAGARTRGPNAAAGILRYLFEAAISTILALKNRFYLNYHNQFKIMVIKMKKDYLFDFIENFRKYYSDITGQISILLYFSAHMRVIVLETYI